MLYISLIFAILLSMTSCQKTKPIPRNQVYIPYVMSGSPDPLNIIYSGDWIVTNHLWAPLLDLKSDGTYEPILAKSWKRSVDGKTWIFELKKDLKWSDGSSMSVDQVVNSLNISREGTSHTDLSKAINSISKISDSEIEFKLNIFVPQFLHGLTYSDWSIVHSDSIEKRKGKAYVTGHEKLSGPYRLKEKFETKSVVKEVNLIANEFYPLKTHKDLQNGAVVGYQSCSEIMENHEKVIAFRMYKDELSEKCKTELLEKGFKVNTEQPSWIIKGDFTKKGLKDWSLEERLSLVKLLQAKIKNEYKDIGNIRATGLRASHLYGSLTLDEFDEELGKIEASPLKKGKKIRIIAMDIWASWKSYHWLVKNLKSLGLEVEETVLDMNGFFGEFGSGKIQTDYDLIFFPLGVGDIDPDGSWRIASRHIFPGLIEPQELHKAYIEEEKEKRVVYYKTFAKRLLNTGRYIPLVMNSDVFGVHESVSIKDGTALRNGTSLFDLE